jgi:hypothetical protein
MAGNTSLDTFVEQLLDEKAVLNKSLQQKQLVFNSFGYDSIKLKAVIEDYKSRIRFLDGQILGYVRPHAEICCSEEHYLNGFRTGVQRRLSYYSEL